MLPFYCKLRKEFKFSLSNETYYGPTCGYEYLVIFKGIILFYTFFKNNKLSNKYSYSNNLVKF